MFDLNEQTRWILGRPNFTCGGVARVLRKGGHEIDRNSNEEQAAVIHWFLTMYEKHGAEWRMIAETKLSEWGALPEPESNGVEL